MRPPSLPDPKSFPSPQKETPHPLSSHSPSSVPRAWQPLLCFLSLWICLFRTFHRSDGPNACACLASIHRLKPTPLRTPAKVKLLGGGAFGRQPGPEGGAFLCEIHALEKKLPKNPSPLPPCESVMQKRTLTWRCRRPDLRLPASGPMSYKFLSLVSPHSTVLC